MGIIAQEIDQQPHAEAGAAFRPIGLDGLDESRPGNVEMEPRIIDEGNTFRYATKGSCSCISKGISFVESCVVISTPLTRQGSRFFVFRRVPLEWYPKAPLRLLRQ